MLCHRILSIKFPYTKNHYVWLGTNLYLRGGLNIFSPIEIINQPEGKTLEFKRDLSSPKNILKTIVAFANTAGGLIIIGVEDSSRAITGVANPLDEEERLCSLIADSIAPRLVPDIDLMSIEDKTLLAVQVYLGGMRPHFLKKRRSG